LALSLTVFEMRPLKA